MNFQNRYKYSPKTDLLGKGGFARVYKANDVLLDREVAVKVFSVQDGGHYTVLEEIKKVIRYEHPNLLRYYDVALLENTNAFGETEELQVGIMEYANAGDLKTFAQKNPGSPLLFKFLQEVLQGLAFLHHNGIIHRDLKPQNILLTEKNGELTAKISDFGISKSVDTGTNSASVAIGTIEYMAPEQFSPNKYGIGGKISTNLDLWSFGIMVHELITNTPPFGQRSGSITAEQIMNSILSAELPADIEKLKDPYKAIIKKCLVADAKLRIRSATELISYFEANQDSKADELQTQVLPKYANRFAADDAKDLETEILNINRDAETQVLERPGASTGDSTSSADAIEHARNQGSDGEDIAEVSASKRQNWIIGGVVALLLCIGLFFYLKPFGASNPNTLPGESPQGRTLNFYNNIEAKIKQKKYDEVLNNLKDSTNLKATNISATALKYYTTALLAKGDTINAIPYITKSVELGINEHAYTLGELYFTGNNVRQSYAKAKFFFDASLNDPRSETMLGNIHFMGLLGKGKDSINYQLSFKYYKSAAKKGNTAAMYSLGLSYLKGYGVKPDYLEAKKWFEKVIAKNDNADDVKAARQFILAASENPNSKSQSKDKEAYLYQPNNVDAKIEAGEGNKSLDAQKEADRIAEQKRSAANAVTEDNMRKYNEDVKWAKNMISVGGCEECKNEPACKKQVTSRLVRALSYNANGTEAKQLLNCLTN